jgi:type IV secretion system protein VirD4
MQTIYLILPPDKLITHGKLLRLWIGVMLTAISRRKRAPAQPTLFLIDEAAQLGPMAELKAALTLMRSYGVRVWTFWQDLSQLKATYPRDWESILNNSSIQQYFGAKSPHAKASLKAFLGDALPDEELSDGHQLVFDGGSTTVMRRPNYLLDPLLMGLASPNPFHAPPR